MPPVASKLHSHQPTHVFEPRPFISQTKVAFETPSTIVYDSKFDTALRASHIEKHYARMNLKKPTIDDQLISSMPSYPSVQQDLDDCARIFPILMKNLHDNYDDNSIHPFYNHNIPKTTTRTFNLVHRNILLQTRYLHENNALHTNKSTMKELKMIFRHESENLSYINSLLDCANFFLGVINSSNMMYSKYYSTLHPDERKEALVKVNKAFYPPLGLQIEWSHNYCILSSSEGSYLMPKSYLLMIHNKVCDIISVLVYSKYASHSSLPPNALKVTQEFLLELWYLNQTHGQKFFTIAKCLEALATAETLSDIEGWDNKNFLCMIIKDLQSDIGFSYIGSTLRRMLRQAPVSFRHELACLSKLSGHPFVDMADGSEKIHKYTTEEYELNYDKINECSCYAKQNYIRNYIVRSSSWPAVTLSPSAPEALVKAHAEGVDPESYNIRQTYGDIKITDYNYVDLQKEMKFNMLENAIPYLKDKTISLMRTGVVNHYINHSKDSKVSWRDTRLLLYYLLRSSEHTDHVQFIKDYSASKSFDDFLDYLVIRIVPKEKELKVAYRGFGCTTYHNRLLFLAQEKNAMEFLDKYNDEQAMTLSEIDLVRRLYAFRCLKNAYPKHRVYYATIDASKWNNHFRPETCDVIMSDLLDKIFGVNIFGKTQQKFQHTLFYVPDGSETYHWEGQSGGIEGLNQDTWVVTYIAQIKTSLSGMNVKYHVLCKGDDLRLAILIPESDVRAQNMQHSGLRIMEKLSEAAKGVGHDIKIYESYGSERYFSFSKSASIDKVELPQAYRKVQKCYGATNAFLPTMDEYIASTYSNAHSACRVTTNVIPCYCVALFWANYYLLSDEKPTRQKPASSDTTYEGLDKFIYYAQRTDDELVALLLCPGLVGGFPIIYLHNMMVRAESDFLSPFLDILRYTENKEPGIYKVLLNFLYFDATKKKTWKPLYSDPYCMPLRKPITASQKLRSYVTPALNKLARNEDIMDLLDLVENDHASKSCIKSMDNSEIIHAKIFSVIFSALPESVLTELVNKFENARSVLELLILRSGMTRSEQILRSVIKADVDVQRWRKNRLVGNHRAGMRSFLNTRHPCPAKWAYELRKTVWQKPVDGITMPPVPHIVSYTTQPAAMHSEHARRHHFQYTTVIPESFISEKHNYHFGVGVYTPFLGKVTSSSMSRPTVHLVEKDLILSKMKTIAELSSWANRTTTLPDGTVTHSNIDTLISKILTLYTNEPLSTFSPLAGSRLTGTSAHHVRTRQYRESIVPNSLSNIYQLVHGDTAQHQGFFSNRQHYWINFLHVFCHCVNMLTFELNVSRQYTTPEIVWVVTTSCQNCTRTIEEPAVIIDENVIRNVRFPRLKMTQINQSAMRVLRESLGLDNTRNFNVEGHLADITPEEATIGLFNSFLDTTIRRQNALTDRYTQHPDNQEGRRVLTHFVPQNFSKYLDLKDTFALDTATLSNCITIAIYRLMCRHIRLNRMSTIDSTLLIMPSITLPWYPLVESLHKSGKLPSVLKYMAGETDTQLLGIQFTPEQVAPHLGILSLKMIGNIHDNFPVVILSNMRDVDIRRVISHHITLAIWKYYYIEKKYFTNFEGHIEDRVASLKACANVILLFASKLTSDTDNEILLDNVNDGEIRLENISVINHEAMDDMMQELDEESAFTLLYPYLQIVSHISPFSSTEIIEHILNNPDAALSDMLSVYESIAFQVTITTPLCCLETLRIHAAEQSITIQDDYIIAQDTPIEKYFHITPTLPKHHFVIAPPYEERSDLIEVPYDKYSQRFDRRNIGNEFLFRALGNSNDTPNRLNYIFHYLCNPKYKGATSGITMSVLGDGIGNGLSFFLTQFNKVRVVYTTRPESDNGEVYPIVCESLIEATRSEIYNNHAREDLFDLEQPHVLLHLERQYGSHNFYFCDAEPSPKRPDAIFDVYFNVIHYFLRTRGHHSILIMQCSVERSSIYLKVLTLLQRYCVNVVNVLPNTVRCVFSQYLVAWGCREDYHQGDLIIPERVPQCLINMMDRIFNNTVHYYENQNKHSSKTVMLMMNESLLNKKALALLTPLWVSYCQRYLNKLIPNDLIESIKSQFQVANDKREVMVRMAPRFEDLISNYMYILQHDVGNPVMVAQHYNMNYREHRIAVVKTLMVAYGWESAFYLVSRGNNSASMMQIRGMFLEICNTLPLRDYNPAKKYVAMFSSTGMMDPDGARLDYWAYYCRGFEFFLSYIAWCSMAAAVTRSNRYFDID